MSDCRWTIVGSCNRQMYSCHLGDCRKDRFLLCHCQDLRTLGHCIVSRMGRFRLLSPPMTHNTPQDTSRSQSQTTNESSHLSNPTGYHKSDKTHIVGSLCGTDSSRKCSHIWSQCYCYHLWTKHPENACAGQSCLDKFADTSRGEFA